MIGVDFDRILDRARKGDELAWSVLYDDLSRPLLGYLRGRGAPEPEDQLCEVFLQIARDLGSFDGDEAGFRSWVFTIAHRRMLDASGKRRRRPSTPLPPDELRPLAEMLVGPIDAIDEAAGRIADQELVLRLLAHLSDEQREVLILRFVADLDTATVGVVTGRSSNAVAAITRRGLVALRGIIEQQAP